MSNIAMKIPAGVFGALLICLAGLPAYVENCEVVTTMKRHINACLFGIWLCSLAGSAYATNCSGLPTQFKGNEFPSGDFFSNFQNSCYTIAIPQGNGSGGLAGDLNSIYDLIYFKVDLRYQLILVGTFPDARYFSVTIYDAHSALAQSILDANIRPLTAQYINPFQVGVPFVSGQQFAVPINFGGTPGKLETGCMMNGYNVDVNALDGTQRHQGMDWNTDSAFFTAHPSFAHHILDTPAHTNPNTGGALMVRNYIDNTVPSYQTSPHLIVRDVASGCAYPAAYVTSTLKLLSNSAAYLDSSQGQDHKYYDGQYLPKLCYQTDPQNHLSWFRGNEYVAGTNPDSSYIAASVPAGLPANLAASGLVMRIRVRIPTAPPTPCSGACSRSGMEQMRYMSLSFLDSGGITLASLADKAFVKDANSYATLIVGTGATIPSWITAANGYTYLDLTHTTGYQQLNTLNMRNILPAATFNCSGQIVPYRTGVAAPAGGLMGDYLPVVDYPAASSLPRAAVPLVGPNACAVFPAGVPGASPSCAVLPEPTPAVKTTVTQCAAPGCSGIVA